MSVVSLPMYDWPEIRWATDAFWRGFALHAGLSGELDRVSNYVDLWRREDLNFSQSCGYPFTHEFKGLLKYVATPHYEADGCEGANYCSIVFAREAKPLSEFYGSVAAINAADSMSGQLALNVVVAPWRNEGEFFKRIKLTGGHRKSLAAVRAHYADICSIDSVCVALAKKCCPQDLEGLVEIARSPQVPGLPFVTRASDPENLVMALEKTFADPALTSAREALLMRDFSVLGPSAYDRILELEATL
jgi:ABC-type phosphate/phosphonate transport system substrate-binding protein